LILSSTKNEIQEAAMRSIIALLIALSVPTSCATASSHWEAAAVGAALADIASTGGGVDRSQGGQFRESNPVYGSNPSSGKMLAVNAGLYAGIWALTREVNPVQRQKVWRAVTILRLLVAGYNVSQTGGLTFNLSF
jgi:hypothetical protein